MKERPILFSAPMVRAILEGRKVQTRRVMKSPPAGVHGLRLAPAICPYGQPGDRLWVRERHHRTTDGEPILFGYDVPGEDREFSVAGLGRVREFREHLGGWGGRVSRNFPSIHMPRWASRITLEITDVRVHRLREISEDDARAEGVEPDFGNANTTAGYDYRRSFSHLWDSINGDGAWDANPWVWAITFRQVNP